MDSPPNKSPDPPDSAFEVATGEDSQESTTLQNAMEPLPDTQQSSEDDAQVSPESHATCAAPLILRPTQPNADDLSIGFSYDKPSAVKPGQFSGRKQPNSFNPIMGPSTEDICPPNEHVSDQTAVFGGATTVKAVPGVLARLPSPEDQRASREASKTQTTQSRPLPVQYHPAVQNMQNNQHPFTSEDLPTTISAPRKKRPFPDYQPTYRAPEPREQFPTPVNSFIPPDTDMTVGSLREHGLAYAKAAEVQQDHQRHPAKTSTISTSQQKPRTSLQNDVSVSSARPPRSMPGSSPRAPVINRLADGSRRRGSRQTTPATRPRSGGSVSWSSHSIVKSNSKAKRASRPNQSSSSSSSSGRSTDDGQETPSMKQRSKWTPAELLQDRFHQKLVTTAADLAGCFNDKFADIGAEVDQHLQTISDLKKGMSKQRHSLSHYKDCILGKDNKIQKLEEHCGQLLAEVNTTRQELDARSSKVSKLEEKCRSYKTFLNNAIAEQQELYKATRAKCDGAISKMQVEERKRIALQENERKKAEDTRVKLKQLVQSTVTEYKQKEQELNNQVEVLSQKLQERDADIVREQNTAQALLQQNFSINNIQDTLKTFGQQIEEVVNKVNEVVAQQCQQGDQSARDMHSKLDQIIQFLRVLDERAPPTAQISQEMRELNEKTVVSISEKLEPIIAAQVQTTNSLDALVSGVGGCLNEVWEELDERQTMLEEVYRKQEVGREQRVKALQKVMEELQGELDHQNHLLFQSEQEIGQKEAVIHKMQLDVASLAQDKEQQLTELKQMDRLREEHAKLKDDSTTKASLVSQLQCKLQETTAKLMTEEQKHQKQHHELQRLIKQQVAEAETAQIRAVEAAQQDTMLKMNEIRAEVEAQLTQVSSQRTALQKELDEAKQKMIAMGTESSRTSEQATEMEKELELSRTELAKSLGQASLKDSEHQNAMEQQLKHVHNLQTKLANAEASFNTLCSNTKSYDKAAQTILSSMKDWTENYATIKSTFRDLRKNKNKDVFLKDIDSKLKPLVELQLLQTAVSQYCQTQKEAAQLLSGDPATANIATRMFPIFESANMAAGNLIDRLRQVTVRSPASNTSSPQPPSVRIEQERRRIGEKPKSILKFIPEAIQDGKENAFPEEDASQQLLKNTKTNRGPYNRPVAGRKSQNELTVAHLSQRISSIPSGSALGRGAGTASNIKRKQSLEQESEPMETRSVKRKTLYHSRLGFSSPPGQAHDKLDLDSLLDAPRNAGWRATTNDEEPSSSAPSQSSQHSKSQAIVIKSRNRTGRLSSTPGRPSPYNSNDALSLFFVTPRTTGAARAKEESQESLTHSQDLGDDGDLPILSRCRFGR